MPSPLRPAPWSRRARAPRLGRTLARRDEQGAVAVEMGIVTMMLITILIGIIDVSWMFLTTYEVSSAARAGARTASSAPMSTTFARDAAQQVSASLNGQDYTRVTRVWVYRANPASPTGEPAAGTDVCSSQCVSFTISSSGIVSAGSGSWTGRRACAGGTVDTVGVRVTYRNQAPVRIGQNALLTETTVMRLEQIPATLTCVSS